MTIPRLALPIVLLSSVGWAAAATTVTCKDGTTANGGRGACHGHGGVDKTKSGGGDAAAASEPAAPASTVTCKDGTTSKGGRGACHGHGGVDKSNSAATSPQPTEPPHAAAKSTSHGAAPAPGTGAANPPASTAKATGHGKAATDDPTGAIAKCKDGQYWHGASHSGSCSHHGGVASWLDGSHPKN